MADGTDSFVMLTEFHQVHGDMHRVAVYASCLEQKQLNVSFEPFDNSYPVLIVARCALYVRRL